jgi:hypothetical protein
MIGIMTIVVQITVMHLIAVKMKMSATGKGTEAKKTFRIEEMKDRIGAVHV